MLKIQTVDTKKGINIYTFIKKGCERWAYKGNEMIQVLWTV